MPTTVTPILKAQVCNLLKSYSRSKGPGADIDPVTNYPFSQVLETAYHEAGHAVMAMLLSICVKEATIDPNNVQAEGGEDDSGKILGYVTTSEYHSDLIKASLPLHVQIEAERRALVSLAGFIAGFIATGVPNRSGAGSDFNKVSMFLRSVESDDEARVHLPYLVAKCQAALEKVWPIVILVAHKLLVVRCLGNAEIVIAFKSGTDLLHGLNACDGTEALAGVACKMFPGDLYARIECINWGNRIREYGSAARQLV